MFPGEERPAQNKFQLALKNHILGQLCPAAYFRKKSRRPPEWPELEAEGASCAPEGEEYIFWEARPGSVLAQRHEPANCSCRATLRSALEPNGRSGQASAIGRLPNPVLGGSITVVPFQQCHSLGERPRRMKVPRYPKPSRVRNLA
jgi:hypothetical protein